MIRTNAEYLSAIKQVEGEFSSLLSNEERFRSLGLTDEEIARGMAPLRTMYEMHLEDIKDYIRSLQGDLSSFSSLKDIGRALVGARLGAKLNQRSFAQVIEVDESQVSRDERNEYGGISIERACEIFDAIGVDVKIDCRFRSAIAEDSETWLHPKTSTAPRFQSVRIVGQPEVVVSGSKQKVAA